jgi:hypothetical protein
MKTMPYVLHKLPLTDLVLPLARAGDALARLDDRIGQSPIRAGFVERSHFSDAAASARAKHELTIARHVLRTRRRIAAQPRRWPRKRSVRL